MRPWNWILILIATFCIGAGAGYHFNNALVARRARLFAESTPADRAAHIAGRLAERLALSDAQRTAVAGVLLSYDERFAAIRNARNEERDIVRENLHRDVEALLTPEQVVLHQKMLAEAPARPPRFR